MKWRLETSAAALAELLDAAPEHDLRRVAAVVVPAALATVTIEDERVRAAEAALELRRFGASAERDALKGLVDELDEVAFELRDEVDAGRREYADYLRAFERARAATALWFALDADATAAAMEGVYEAAATVDVVWAQERVGAVLGVG